MVGSGVQQQQLVVVALGGNALLQRNQPLTWETQVKNTRTAAQALARTQGDYKLCMTHGNGPQVGMLAELDPHTPLDVLGAESQGQLGYLLANELGNALGRPQQQLASLLTRTRVDPEDQAFKDPTKPVGPFYDKEQADKLAKEKGWTFKQKGNKWRRVVPSPAPLEIMEARSIQLLVQHDIITICCGGGGIPVAYEDADGEQGQQQQERQQGQQEQAQQEQGQQKQAQQVGSGTETTATVRDQNRADKGAEAAGTKVP